jgi:hypothetical protein
MLSSRFAFFSGAFVGGWILARPVANGLQLSPDMVYGPLVAAGLAAGLLALLFRNPVLPRPSAWALLYLVYLAVLALRQIAADDGPGVGISLHGFAALGLPVTIYLIGMRSTAEARARAIHLFIGPLLGFSAIVSVLYFFFDFTLWGLIQHHVYTDLIHTNDAVDRRAIGLLASPQSHALSMVVLLVVAVTGRQRWPRLSLVLGGLAVVGGLLSGSKAFMLGALLVAASQLPRALVLLGLLPLLLTAWFAAEFLADTGLRAFTLLSAAQNVDEYTATPLWMAALSYASDLQRLMLGLGLGVMGALSEALESSPLDFSSTESYLLQIAVEAGLLGLLLFVAMLVSALRRPGHPGQPALSPLLFLAIFVNAIFTPALYGFGNAALAGLLLAHTRRNP